MSFSWLINNFLAALLLPPLNGLLLAGIGFLLWRRSPGVARFLVAAGCTLIAALSLGVVARALLVPLETRYPPLADTTVGNLQVEAIVVLGAGRYQNAPEFGSDDVIGAGLDRLRYGALLAKQSRKPLLLSGGAPDGGAFSEAEAMQAALQRDFGLQARWVESTSANTAENARQSAAVLHPAGIRRIALVTHALHMPRAVAAFEAAGFSVQPAPTGYIAAGPATALDFVPRAGAMHSSARALHEWIGQAWYAFGR
ncbi:MAG TPA: YdcF family protein [Azospira sp.]|nr:YdcF family protein [Azospira sp.]HNN07506.1 YdcF family protein [Azospira sp.]